MAPRPRRRRLARRRVCTGSPRLLRMPHTTPGRTRWPTPKSRVPGASCTKRPPCGAERRPRQQSDDAARCAARPGAAGLGAVRRRRPEPGGPTREHTVRPRTPVAPCRTLPSTASGWATIGPNMDMHHDRGRAGDEVGRRSRAVFGPDAATRRHAFERPLPVARRSTKPGPHAAAAWPNRRFGTRRRRPLLRSHPGERRRVGTPAARRGLFAAARPARPHHRPTGQRGAQAVTSALLCFRIGDVTGADLTPHPRAPPGRPKSPDKRTRTVQRPRWTVSRRRAYLPTMAKAPRTRRAHVASKRNAVELSGVVRGRRDGGGGFGRPGPHPGAPPPVIVTAP